MIKTVSFAPPRNASSRPSKASTPKAGKRAASGSSAQISMDLSAEIAVPVAPAKSEAPAPKKAIAKELAPKPVEAKTPRTKAASSKPAPPEAVEVPNIFTASEPVAAEKAKPKARKPRVPADLAAQYGEKPTARPEIVPLLDDKTPKKRLNKAEREARRELIKPDEGLLARLARTTQIVVKKPKSQPRGKGWKFECGRCGQTSYFETPAGLCACGAFAIKE